MHPEFEELLSNPICWEILGIIGVAGIGLIQGIKKHLEEQDRNIEKKVKESGKSSSPIGSEITWRRFIRRVTKRTGKKL